MTFLALSCISVFILCVISFKHKEREVSFLYLYLNTDIPEDTKRQDLTLSHQFQDVLKPEV